MTRTWVALLAALLPAGAAAQHAAATAASAQRRADVVGGRPATDAALLSTLVALDRRLWEAVRDKNTPAFVRETAPGWIDIEPSRVTRPSAADMTKDMQACDTRSFQIDSATVVRAGATAAVLTYRVQVDQTCGGERVLTPDYVTEVWAQRTGRWQLVTLVFTPVQPAGK